MLLADIGTPPFCSERSFFDQSGNLSVKMRSASAAMRLTISAAGTHRQDSFVYIAVLTRGLQCCLALR
jgi:hypothetical protein